MKSILPAITLLLAVATSAGAQPSISGPQSGTLGPGAYIVTGDLSIVHGDSLTIAPGTTFYFDGPYDFNIGPARTLIAQGTVDDSIRFLPNLGNGVTQWGHLDVDTATVEDPLAYCLISGGHSDGGGGVAVSHSSLILSHCTIEGCSAEQTGGGISVFYSDLTLNHCNILQNHSDEEGGGLFLSHESTLTMNDCSVNENTSWGDGGGICCNYDTVSDLFSVEFSGNSASDVYSGGGIYAYEARLTLSTCTVVDNSARYGGGISAEWGSLVTIQSCNIFNNTAQDDGGGMNCIDSSELTITNSSFTGNSIVGYGQGGGLFYDCFRDTCTVINTSFVENMNGGPGGGVYCDAEFLDMQECQFNGNTAMHGGGLYCLAEDASLLYCDFNDNEIALGGGGVYVYSGSCSLDYCTFTNNLATGTARVPSAGGAVYVDWIADLTMVRCLLENNTADRGGGITNYYNTIEYHSTLIDNCTIRNNTATLGAGGIYCSYSSPEIVNCLITGNTAGDFGGGGIGLEVGHATITNCTIDGNLTTGDGGGIAGLRSDPEINSCLITNNEDVGIFADYFSDPVITYSNAFNNSDGELGGNGIDPEIGDFQYTNINGDPCDIANNISLDPFYIDPASGDYHLQASSPCIDAGDPDLALDPDDTIADIGAFYYHQETGVNERHPDSPPTRFELVSIFPNPFNPSTTVSITLPRSAELSVSVVNTLGQTVAELAHGSFTAGTHSFVVDGSNLASGIYFVRATVSGELNTVRKIVLMK